MAAGVGVRWVGSRSTAIGQYLPSLIFLACPISMGVMMWMMMRGTRHAAATPGDEARIQRLEQELRELRGEIDANREPEPSASHH
jgi:hypothetical protein